MANTNSYFKTKNGLISKIYGGQKRRSKKKKRIIFAIFVIVFFSGCHNQVTICPTYPKPSKTILTSIKSLNDDKIDQWMIKQLKLYKKLKVCNEL